MNVSPSPPLQNIIALLHHPYTPNKEYSLLTFVEVFPTKRAIRTLEGMDIGPGLTKQTGIFEGIQRNKLVVGHIPNEALTIINILVWEILLTVGLTTGIVLLNYITKGCNRSLLLVPLFTPILYLLGCNL